jgi:hypothetical protein
MTHKIPQYHKDPDAFLDYRWDWAPWLDGDTISAHEILADPGIDVQSSSNDDTAVVVWLAGGTVGVRYRITCRVTTAAGRIQDDTIHILLKAS